jgi:alpha-galactosidase
MQLATADGFLPKAAQLNGLDPKRKYRVRVVAELSAHDLLQKSEPSWWPEFVSYGDALTKIGLEMPGLRPESGLLLHLVAL